MTGDNEFLFIDPAAFDGILPARVPLTFKGQKIGMVTVTTEIPGWEGSIGPSPAQYHLPHVYARDVHSGAGNCVCGRALGDKRHVMAAPGVEIPDHFRQ